MFCAEFAERVHFEIFFYFSPLKWLLTYHANYFSKGDNLHEMSRPNFFVRVKNKKIYFKMFSADFAERVHFEI